MSNFTFYFNNNKILNAIGSCNSNFVEYDFWSVLKFGDDWVYKTSNKTAIKIVLLVKILEKWDWGYIESL